MQSRCEVLVGPQICPLVWCWKPEEGLEVPNNVSEKMFRTWKAEGEFWRGSKGKAGHKQRECYLQLGGDPWKNQQLYGTNGGRELATGIAGKKESELLQARSQQQRSWCRWTWRAWEGPGSNGNQDERVSWDRYPWGSTRHLTWTGTNKQLGNRLPGLGRVQSPKRVDPTQDGLRISADLARFGPDERGHRASRFRNLGNRKQ